MTTRTELQRIVRDILVKHQVYLERLKASDVRNLDPVLRSLDRAVREALMALGDAPSRTALERTLSRLRRTNGEILAKYSDGLLASLQALSRYASGFHSETVALLRLPGGPAMVTPASAAAWAEAMAGPVQATGQLLEPFIKSFSTRAVVVIDRTIRNGIARGLTTEAIVRMLRGTKAARFRDGLISSLLKREGIAIVRTAIQHVNNSAQFAVYESNPELVKKYRWLSTLDSRTSQICRSLDGQVFDRGKGPMPPAHINCRSFTIPIVDGIDPTQGAKRASKGAEGGQQVDARLVYYDWLKTQPADFQDDALGPARAMLFRKGGLSAEEFAKLNLNKDFQPLTLKQMRKKNPAAFARAGLEL